MLVCLAYIQINRQHSPPKIHKAYQLSQNQFLKTHHYKVYAMLMYAEKNGQKYLVN